MHEHDPRDFLTSLSPLGGLVNVQDIADAVLYLTEARQVTARSCTSMAERMLADGN
jgi:hypothetical protein